MHSADREQNSGGPGRRVPSISPRDNAAYTEDLLGQLREMARVQNQDRLASLLEAARREAESLSDSEVPPAPTNQ